MPSIRDTLCNTTPGALVARQRSSGQSVGDAVYPGYAVGTHPSMGQSCTGYRPDPPSQYASGTWNLVHCHAIAWT